MIKIYRKIWRILTYRERKYIIFLIFLSILQSLSEVLGIFSIYPFFRVLSDSTVVNSDNFFGFLYRILNFSNTNHFLFFLSFCALILIFLRTALTFISNYSVIRFVRMRSHFISQRLLRSYIHKPYTFFFEINRSDLTSKILSEVELVAGGCILPSILLISQIFTLSFIVISILFVNPITILVPFIFISIVYGVINKIVREKTNVLGKKRNQFNSNRFRIIQEIFDGIKDVKISDNEAVYINQFTSNSKNYTKTFLGFQLFSDVPFYILEMLTITSGFFVILILIYLENGNLEKVIPILSVIVLAGARIIPAIKKLYQQILSIEFNNSSLDNLKVEVNKNYSKKNQDLSNDFSFLSNIKLDKLSFKYPGTNKYVIKDLSFEIKKNSSLAIVGSTGSGKSTLIDILVGLMEPTKGNLTVDNKIINSNNNRSWLNKIGYFPQDVFIADTSILKNIAFGIKRSQINLKDVRLAAKKAGILDLIEKELPEKFDTEMGDRGIKFSGGQKQRIGLARSFYLNNEIIILDEATSSLDNITEKKIINSLMTPPLDKTIIMISHRLDSIKNFDQIIFLEKGKLICSGKYEDIIENEKFKKFAS